MGESHQHGSRDHYQVDGDQRTEDRLDEPNQVESFWGKYYQNAGVGAWGPVRSSAGLRPNRRADSTRYRPEANELSEEGIVASKRSGARFG
jgi:hypothetical protein